MSLMDGIGLLKTVFADTSMFGNYWIYQLMILFGTLVIITRAWKDWGDLALPVVTGWTLIGFRFNYVFFAVTGMLFVISAISLKTIESGLSSVGGLVKEVRFKKVRMGAMDNRLALLENEMKLREKSEKIKSWKQDSDIKEWKKMKSKKAQLDEYEKERFGGRDEKYKVLNMQKTGEPVVLAGLSRLYGNKTYGREKKIQKLEGKKKVTFRTKRRNEDEM